MSLSCCLFSGGAQPQTVWEARWLCLLESTVARERLAHRGWLAGGLQVTAARWGCRDPEPLGQPSVSGRWVPPQRWCSSRVLSHIWEEPDLAPGSYGARHLTWPGPRSLGTGRLGACGLPSPGGAGPLGDPHQSGRQRPGPASWVGEGAGNFINRGFLWLCTPTPCCCHLAGRSLGPRAAASVAPGEG